MRQRAWSPHQRAQSLPRYVFLYCDLVSSHFSNSQTGITGNALALEDKDFEHFLTYTTGHEMKSMEKDGMLEKSSCPESLFGGEAGRAWSWAVADKGLDKRILGYNDL
jgi:hypothetical protein